MEYITDVVEQMRQEVSYGDERDILLKGLNSECITLFKRYNAFIAGGAITSVFSNKKIVDYDVFFRTEELFKGCYGNFGSHQRIATTPNAVTFKMADGSIIQLIRLDFFPTPKDIFNVFDFTVCCALYDFNSGGFTLHESFLKHLSQRKLIFNTAHKFPISSLSRSQKYKDRGFTLDQKNYFKIVMKIASLEIKTNADAAKQFQGMYFGTAKVEFQEFSKDESPFNIEKFLTLVEISSELPVFETSGVGSTIKDTISSPKRSSIAIFDDDLPF